jgi:hypothetical protein
MKHFYSFIFAVILFTQLFFSVSSSYGQCCSAGSPLGASTYGGIVEKNSFRLSTYVRYSRSDDYYTGSTKDPNSFPLQYADFLFQGLTIGYGISKKINIEVELGYFYFKNQYYPEEPPYPQIIFKGSGLSNGIFSAKYALFKSISKGLEITAGAGLKFPFSTKPLFIGKQDIEPSTNAYGWMGQMIIQKEFKARKITLFLYNRYEQNFANENKYDFGDRYRVSLIASKKIKKNFGVMIQTRYEYIAPDISNSVKDPNTGANLIFVSPQILYSLKGKWNFIVGVDLPAYKNYKGRQISNNYAVSLSLTHDIGKVKK